jgi:hypothetical protein
MQLYSPIELKVYSRVQRNPNVTLPSFVHRYENSWLGLVRSSFNETHCNLPGRVQHLLHGGWSPKLRPSLPFLLIHKVLSLPVSMAE